MQLHQLKPEHGNKNKKRVGRGGRKGTYSGRGMKGQKSRAGKKPRPTFAGGDTPFFKRMPKLRGQRAGLDIKQGVKWTEKRPVSLNLYVLNKYFEANETVNPRTLVDKGIIRKIKNRIPKVKILGEGQLTKKIKVEGCLLSASAKDKLNLK